MKTLALTSPYTVNADVKTAQAALRGNVFNADYLRDTVDGVFGENTARGCVRAKYWVGYDLYQQQPIYGDLLHSYLTGRRPLPARMMKIRQARIVAATAKPIGVKALEHLAQYVGTTEDPPNTNTHPISTWYGVRGPWCAMAVTKGMVAAGSTSFVKGSYYAYVPFMVIDARAGRRGLQIIPRADAKPGDIVCYDWQKGGQFASPYAFDHTGILRSKVAADGSFKTREGNTSDDWGGSQSNGGGMFDRDDRDMDRATCIFIRASR